MAAKGIQFPWRDIPRHGRYVTFEFAEAAIPRRLLTVILQLIDGLRPRPAPT